MVKARIWFVLAAFLLSFSQEVYSQMDHQTIRKNNKKYMTFKGKKSNFSKEKRYFSLGFAVNALNYYGDLAPNPGRFSTDISFTRPAFTLNYSNRLGPRYAITAGFTYGTLRGSDFSSAD